MASRAVSVKRNLSETEICVSRSMRAAAPRFYTALARVAEKRKMPSVSPYELMCKIGEAAKRKGLPCTLAPEEVGQ